MSKLTKNDLKGIVKECLLEILAEGLGAPAKAKKSLSPKQKLRRALNEKKNRRLGSDTEFNEESENLTANPGFDSKIMQTVKSATNDPILAEILADTAQTTLQEQLSADSKKGLQSVGQHGDQAAKIAESASPDELFGEEVAGKWASLAFG